MISEDIKQKVQTTFQFFLEIYKVFIASLLCVFVPQKCTNQPDNLCTINDNLFDLDNYNMVCVCFNFTTLFFFLVLYIYEYKREQWCINYFDIDEKKLDDYLYKEIEEYPEYKERIYKFNKRYWILTLISVTFNIVNIFLSSVLIFKFFYLDYRSITVFFTNSILTIDRLSNCYHVSNVSNDPSNNLLAISSYMSKSMVFNTIDEEYVIQKEMNDIPSISNTKKRFEKSKIQLLAEKYSRRC